MGQRSPGSYTSSSVCKAPTVSVPPRVRCITMAIQSRQTRYLSTRASPRPHNPPHHFGERRTPHFGLRAKGKGRGTRQYARYEPVSNQLKRFISSAVHPVARGVGGRHTSRTACAPLPPHECRAGCGTSAHRRPRHRSRVGKECPRAWSVGSHIAIPPTSTVPASLGRCHRGAAGQG
jgi:hypothetical protein